MTTYNLRVLWIAVQSVAKYPKFVTLRQKESPMKYYAAALATLLSSILAPGPSVRAATTTSSFQVSITITTACQITAAPNLDFGSVGVLSGNVDATNPLSIICTLAAPYNVGLDAGTGSGATMAARKMTGPSSATVTYSMYRDPTRLLVWGNTVGTDTLAGLGTGLALPHIV